MSTVFRSKFSSIFHRFSSMFNLYPQLERSTVQNSESGLMEPASYRISKTAWLKRSESPTVERIYGRVGHLTGLSMEFSEDLQVANYGMGGHYDPHFDHARVRPSETVFFINDD